MIRNVSSYFYATGSRPDIIRRLDEEIKKEKRKMMMTMTKQVATYNTTHNPL